jgi:hypothetical protein
MDNFADSFGGEGGEPGGLDNLGEDVGGGGVILDGDDPAAEFLAREQQELAGLEDDDEIKLPIVTNGLSSGK